MKLKTAVVSLALAMTGALASASMVTLPTIGVTDPINDVQHFTLDTDSVLTGVIKTTSMLDLNATINLFELSNGLGVDYKFGSVSGATPFASFGDVSTPIYFVDNGQLVDTGDVNWIQTYLTGPMFLAAGDWTLTVDGAISDNKYSTKLDVSLVPEPQSLALALGALAALGLVRRRQKSVIR